MELVPAVALDQVPVAVWVLAPDRAWVDAKSGSIINNESGESNWKDNVHFVEVPDTNHYTIVMGTSGTRVVAQAIVRALQSRARDPGLRSSR